MSALRPIHDRITVRRVTQLADPTSLIFVLDTFKDPGVEGLVVAVGPGVYDKRGKLTVPTIKAGDRILFGTGLGQPVTIDGDNLLMIREGDVMGVLS